MLRDYLRGLMLPLDLIDKSLPQSGNIIELGCGEGVISKFIANNKKRNVLGIDINKKRLPREKRKNLNFKYADIRSYKTKNVDGFVISDVLHHLETDEQKTLLKNLSYGLKKGGVLVIKEIDTQEFFRSKLSRIWDFVLYPKDKISYWNSKDLKLYLKKFGFETHMTRACPLFPGSTNVFVAKK